MGGMSVKIGSLSPARWGRGFSRLNFRRAEECDAVLDWLEAGAGERILDVGSGDGYYDWRISRSGARVTGIDLHEKRLAYARKHYGSGTTEFLTMDAEKADFPAGSYDKAMSLCVMEHLGDDERVMRNVAKALRPGGRFVFSADSLSNPGLRPRERERHKKRYAVNTFYTPEVVRDKLARTGFDVEDTRFVMDSPFALGLVRLSWKLDRLPRVLAPVRTLGYVLLGAVWSVSRPFRAGRAAVRRYGRADHRRPGQEEGGVTAPTTCVIIAAGRGSRLAGRAASKPLLEVAGKTLIDRAIDAARASGVREFVVVTGYAGEAVERHLTAKAAADGLSIATVRNDEWEKENGLSVGKAAGLAGDRFFLVMADHIVDPGLLAGLSACEIGRDEVILAVDTRIEGHPHVDLDDVTRVRDEAGRIAAIGKNIADFNAFDTGVFLCTPALFEALAESQRRGDFSLSGGIRVMAAKGTARTWAIGDHFWIDVDDEAALQKAEAAIAGGLAGRPPETGFARSVWRPSRLLLGGAGFLLLAYLILKIGLGTVLAQVAQFGPWFLATVAIAFAWLFVQACAWGLVQAAHFRPVPLLRLFRAKIVSDSLNALIPSASIGGDAARAFLIRRTCL